MELRAETSMLDDESLATDITNAQNTADITYAFAYNTTQYYWFNASDNDTGAHVSFVAKDVFEDTEAGYNLLIAGDAIALRYGLAAMAILDVDSLNFYNVDADSMTRTQVASFGATTSLGIQDDTTSYIILDDTGMQVYELGDLVASFGASALIGNTSTYAVQIMTESSDTESASINLYQDGYKVAYLSTDVGDVSEVSENSQFYAGQVNTIYQLGIGVAEDDGGYGQWAWRVHQINGENNLYLKWIG